MRISVVILVLSIIGLVSCEKIFHLKYEGIFTAGQTEGDHVYYNILEDTVNFFYNSLDYLDIDNDGIDDLGFESFWYTKARDTCNIYIRELAYITEYDNAQVALMPDSIHPKPLELGDTISQSMIWGPSRGHLAQQEFCDSDYSIGNYRNSGEWLNSSNKHLAVRIIRKDTVYAWIRLTTGTFTIEIHDYAYIRK